MEKSKSGADITLISVNTPKKKNCLWVGQVNDLSWVQASSMQVAKYANAHTT